MKKNAGLQINIIEAANYSVHVILAKIFNLFHSVEMTDMKRNKLVFALVTITRNILKLKRSELLLFSVSSRQPPDPHRPEAGEHLVL